MKYTKITSDVHKYMGGKLESVSAPYALLVAVLGEPYKNSEPDYPDDPHKTDVCWVVHDELGRAISIWNYKNGPAYNDGEGTIEELDYFSVWYSDLAAFEDFSRELLKQSVAVSAT